MTKTHPGEEQCRLKLQTALSQLIEHHDIRYDDMLDIMRQIMCGEASPVLIAGFLTALRVKQESVDEIAAAAKIMREFSTKVPASDVTGLVDICGTGGDGAQTFNISTAAMFVAAAAGARVAKHGGRSVSSQCGSADVLEALGVNIQLAPPQVAACLKSCGIGFMFAPNHHRAMKHAAPVRRELGVRTLFNLLGPLTNPAEAPRQLMGVFNQALVGIQIRVLQRLGSERALTVFGQEGLDEISISGETWVGELRNGAIREYALRPEDFGLQPQPLSALRVNNADASRQLLLRVLENEPGAARDIVALNAGACLYVAGVAESLPEGLALAMSALASGAARAKLADFVQLTQQLATA